MGCGQSKIGIYQRKSKNKKNGGKRSDDNEENDEEGEDVEERTISDVKEPEESGKKEEDPDSMTARIKQMAQATVLAQSHISASQLDFFKMLDEKIENGPDYEESDEEERKARFVSVLQEWRATCSAGQQKRNEMKAPKKENWNSPSRGIKPYQEDYEKYPGRRINPVDTQRFPTGYSQCPPNNTLGVHLQNSLRVNIPYADQSRMQPRIQFHSFQSLGESYNPSDDPSGHPLSTNEPSNPFRPNYSQAVLRQSSITSQIQSYPENQRLYDNIRQLPDYPRPYQDQKPYQMPRPMPTVNVLHDYRTYNPDTNPRLFAYQEDVRDMRPNEDVARMMIEMSIPSHDTQRSDNIRPPFEIPNQRIYHDRLIEKQNRQYSSDGPRQIEGPRPPIVFQRPQLLTQRSVQEPPRMYRELENEDHCYPRQERFSETPQEGSSGGRILNPNHYQMGRSLSVDVQYVAGPPPPREMIPLQGAPGPPQGSPRPLVARGLYPNMPRLPANPVPHFRRTQGSFPPNSLPPSL